MTRTIDLAGEGWQLREALGLTWHWYIAAPLPVAGNNVGDAAAAAGSSPGWTTAAVPGSVIADLHRAGDIPDPYTGRNSRFAEWVSERSWVYRRAVEMPQLAAGERAVLEFDGIDPGGRIFWDGEEVARVQGLYRRTRVDVTPHASPGSHTLAVVLDPAPVSQPQVGRTDEARVHRPRMNEGWDFCPRLRHQGIWKGVRLVTGLVHRAEVTAAATLHPGLSHGRVDVRVRVEAPPEFPVTVDVEVLDGDTVVARASTVAQAEPAPSTGAGVTSASAVLRLDVAHPRLWWPNGLGDPALHTVRVMAHTGSGGSAQRSGAWSAEVGFRRTRMLPNPGGPEGALPYTLEVNDRIVPVVGWNWVPADALYGTIPEGRVEHLVDLAAQSGARLLRVWGGGLIETEAFYRACDRAGILVWQEFSQSSSGMQSAPAEDDEFVHYLAQEAAAIVPTLTHHPSLVLWGGGNELDEGGVPLTDARSPALAALHHAVARLDPHRHWLPTSPTGPEFHNRLDRIRANPTGQHDVHGPWEHQGLEAHYTLYNAGMSLAHTEFGVEGMTNTRSLNALVPEESRWPTDRSNPVYRHLGEWWNNADLVQGTFGGRLDTVERMQRASQFLQATGLQYAVEADRRRAPRLSMVLPWQLNESYPNAWCTSSVDYRGDTKPAYHAVARAFRPERATLRVDRAAWAGHDSASAEAWLWSENGRTAGGRVVLRLLSMSGDVLAEESAALGEVTSPQAVLRLQVPVTDVAPGGPLVFWEVDWTDRAGQPVDREIALASFGSDLSGLLDLEPASVEVSQDAPADDAVAIRVRHRGGPAVLGMRIVDARPVDAPGWAVIDGDPRPLMPGEERSFLVRWRGDAATSRVLRMESWNTEPAEITVGR